MSVLVDEVSRICRAHRTAEKILVVPSMAAGRQLTDAIARAGTPWINLRVATIRSLAHEVAGPAVAAEGLRLVSHAQALALVEHACLDMLSERSYFGALRDKPGFHRAMLRTLDELRASGLTAESLSAPLFEDGRKRDEIAAILSNYGSRIDALKLIDRSALLRRAIALLKRESREPHPSFHVVGPVELSPVDRELLDLVSGGRWSMLDGGGREAWIGAKREVALVQAVGEENEVREVFRRIVSSRSPLDCVEVLYSERDPYLPLIFEIAAENGIRCTFAEGISVLFTRPGQAAAGFLRWIAGRFDAEALRRSIAAGVFDWRSIAADRSSPGSIVAARIVRSAGIGFGLDRYVPRLDAVVADRRRDAELESDEDEIPANVFEMAQHAAVVRDFVARLVSAVPSPSEGCVTRDSLAAAAALVVRNLASVASEADGMARDAIEETLLSVASLTSPEAPIANVAERLLSAVAEIRVRQSLPEPGAVHVSSLAGGGWSGRRSTFIVGLDESRHPGAGTQDPVILDGERARINESSAPLQLSLRGEAPSQNSEAFFALLCRTGAELTLSYSCVELVEGRWRFPAAVMLDTWRAGTGNADADYEALEAELEPRRVSYASRDGALSETEWWLGRASGGLHPMHSPDETMPRETPLAAMARSDYPWLETGWRAEQARRVAELGSHDGLIVADSSELDPRRSGKVLSASRLETLGKCPHRYFFKYLLRIEPLEEPRHEPGVWLDALELGSLVHEILYDFMSAATGRREIVRSETHAAELREIAEGALARCREEIPPPNEASFEARRRELAELCANFLKLEDERAGKAKPRWFEVGFGKGEDATHGFGSAEPVTVAFGKSVIALNGSIDRVDEAGSGKYEIWDYKSGSTWGFRENALTDGGRVLQFGLYARVFETLLGMNGKRGSVVNSGYIFPGRKGQGARIEKGAPSSELDDAVGHLLDVMSTGAFVRTEDAGTCVYCDFRLICGRVGELAGKTQALLDGEPAKHRGQLAFQKLRKCR